MRADGSVAYRWKGLMRAKHLRMCETQPQKVESMNIDEMDRYLNSLYDRYLERTEELYFPCLKRCGVEGPQETWSHDPMFFKMYKTAHMMAQDIARQEMMDA